MKRLKNRVCPLFLLVVCLLTGCSLGGSSGGATNSPPFPGAIVRGRILANPTVVPPSLRVRVLPADAVSTTAVSTDGHPAPAVSADPVGIKNVTVFLESQPSIQAVTNASGEYALQEVPEGEQRIVAIVGDKTSGNLMKMISDSLLVTHVQTYQVPSLLLEPAINYVTGRLLDSSGNPLPAGAELSLWGERFETIEGGRFISPRLPERFSSASITLLGEDPSSTPASRRVSPSIFAGTRTRHVRTTFSAPFVSGTAPSHVELTVKGTGETNSPPTCALKALVDGVETTKLRPGEKADLVLTVSDPDPADRDLRIEWSCSAGTLSPQPWMKATRLTWAPSASREHALITATVKDSHGAFARCTLDLLVGISDPNELATLKSDIQLIVRGNRIGMYKIALDDRPEEEFPSGAQANFTSLVPGPHSARFRVKSAQTGAYSSPTTVEWTSGPDLIKATITLGSASAFSFFKYKFGVAGAFSPPYSSATPFDVPIQTGISTVISIAGAIRTPFPPPRDLVWLDSADDLIVVTLLPRNRITADAAILGQSPLW